MRNEHEQLEPKKLLEIASQASKSLIKLARKPHLPKKFWRSEDISKATKLKCIAGMAAIALYSLSGPIGKGLEEVAHKLPEDLKDALGRQRVDDFDVTLVATESEFIADAVASIFTPQFPKERKTIPTDFLHEEFKGNILLWEETRSIIPILKVRKLLECGETIDDNGKISYEAIYRVSLVGRNHLYSRPMRIQPPYLFL